jgi:hypothetical protein
VQTQRLLLRIVLVLAIALFVLLYPVLISVYVFLPLFVGYAGWLLIRGFEGDGGWYIVPPLIYLINLEVNLSLPLLMSLFATLLYYLVLYDRVLYLKRCKVCVAIISVAAIDGLYLLTLTTYDALMDTTTLVLSSLQWYSLIADIVMVVL